MNFYQKQSQKKIAVLLFDYFFFSSPETDNEVLFITLTLSTVLNWDSF